MIELVQGDVRDKAVLRFAVREVDTVFHQAALASVPWSVEDPGLFHEADATGTLNLLIAARDARVRRVVYASTSAVYGTTGPVRKREDMPVAPVSPYGVAKLAGEMYCRAFTQSYGLETVSLRYFNIFGGRQSAKSSYGAVVPIFITHALRGEPLTIFGDGKQSRDFVYIANVVQANMQAMTCRSAVGGAFNVGCGKRYTVLDLVTALGEVMGRQIAPEFRPERTSDVRHSVADLTLARMRLQYMPAVGFTEGLVRTVAWFNSNTLGQEFAT
jgi:nucleoside-diphosphate-sugar epimerase